jgi:sulfopyruvate decarboxylase subunit beta
MNRQDVIRIVLETISRDTVVVSNIADASFELCWLGDRPRNFYMLGSLGLAPSIGLGLALSRPEKVVVVNGDGALLFNLGCLATEGRYRPANLIHLVVDNGAHGATGHQPTATSAGTDLAAVAAGCGLRASCVEDRDALRRVLTGALAQATGAVIVVKVAEKPPCSAPLPPYQGREIRDRFMNALREPDAADWRKVA